MSKPTKKPTRTELVAEYDSYPKYPGRLGFYPGFYPEITDGCKRVENFWSCLATLRRILGLWNRSMYSNTSARAASSVG